MKFAKSDEHRAIYLDIQVGKLLPMGVVDHTKVYWMGIKTSLMKPSPRFFSNLISLFRIDPYFATIDYDNQLSLSLTDEIKFSSRNQVVTGELIHFSNDFLTFYLICF